MGRMSQLPDGGVETHGHRRTRLMLEQGAQFYPRVPGGVSTRSGGGRKFPGAPLSERKEQAEANQAIHEGLLWQSGSSGGDNFLQEDVGHHSGLAKLQLLDHSSYAFRECPCGNGSLVMSPYHAIGVHMQTFRRLNGQSR